MKNAKVDHIVSKIFEMLVRLEPNLALKGLMRFVRVLCIRHAIKESYSNIRHLTGLNGETFITAFKFKASFDMCRDNHGNILTKCGGKRKCLMHNLSPFKYHNYPFDDSYGLWWP